MITATAWVPRGHAAAFPTRYVFDEDEYARISKLAKLELEDAREDLENARQAMNKTNGESNGNDAIDPESSEKSDDEDDAAEAHSDNDDDLKEYDMEHYDDEPEVRNNDDDEEDAAGPNDSIFGNIKGLAYHTDNKDDPYITLPDNGEQSDDDEREELQIFPTDNMILAARIEDEVAHLECYVYEDEADNLYVHHDVMLPAMPLCVEWVNARPNDPASTGNFAAVGTMDPDIELWNLDIVDGMYPTAILGASSEPVDPVTAATKPKKKKKSKKPNPNYHTSSILALAANRTHSNLLASASADTTIKLWDLHTCTAAQSYAHHTDKVCTLAWHPRETSVLLSGSYDRTVVAADMRAPDAASPPRWGVESDVEQVRWDPHGGEKFYVSTEEGMLHCFDARTLPRSPEESKALWTLAAHDQAVASFAVNPVVPGFFATGSTDRTVKLWSVAPTTSSDASACGA